MTKADLCHALRSAAASPACFSGCTYAWISCESGRFKRRRLFSTLAYYWRKKDKAIPGPIAVLHISPAKKRFFRVGDAGFEPATSAVQVRATYATAYPVVSEMRLSEPHSALDGQCDCRQMSSRSASTDATLLPPAAYLANPVS